MQKYLKMILKSGTIKKSRSKRIIIIGLVLLLFFVVVNFPIKEEIRNPVELAELHLKIKFSREVVINQFIDRWSGPDGETFIDLNYNEQEENFIVDHLIEIGFKNNNSSISPSYFILGDGKLNNNFNGYHLFKNFNDEITIILVNIDNNKIYIDYNII